MIYPELHRLRVCLWFHRYLYYVLDQSILIDTDYDNLERRLKKLEAEYPEKLEESPTHRVGYDPPTYLLDKIGQLVNYHYEVINGNKMSTTNNNNRSTRST